MFVYFIRNEITRNVKIGSSDDPQQRLRLLQQGNDCRLTLVAELAGGPSLEAQFHHKWHEYRIYDEGSAGQEWFSIDVEPNGRGGVTIIGRNKQRPPKRNKEEKRRKQLCLRLSNRQILLLERYSAIRHFDSEVEALRFMIDGLEDWLARQASKGDIAGSSGAPAQATSIRTGVAGGDARRSDVARPEGARSDVARSDVSRPTQELVEDSPEDQESPVGDFGGRPSIGLPKPSWNDGNED